MKRDIAREPVRSYRTKSRKTNNQEEERSKKDDPEKLSNIKAESTSWATQLRLLTPELLKNIRSRSEGALVDEVTVIGPNTPSWKRGLRTIRGARGPRDTYG